jgi:hypothetical protein
VKLWELCPEATVTLEGTVRLALLLESDTANPLPDAVPVNATEQEVLPGVLIVELVQVRLLSEIPTGREMAPATPLARMEEPLALVPITFTS